MNRLRKTKVIAQASTSIFPLESSEHVPRIYGRHHPESPLTLNFQNVRSPNQMAIAKPPILVFPRVAKHYADACARPDGNTAEIGGHWNIKTLFLGFDYSLEIEICVAFSVEIYIYGVEHHCAPVLFASRYQEFRTEPEELVSCGILGKFQADRIMLERKTGLRLASASILKSRWCEV